MSLGAPNELESASYELNDSCAEGDVVLSAGELVPDVELVCSRLKTLLAQFQDDTGHTGLQMKALRQRYWKTYGPMEASQLGFEGFRDLCVHAGLVCWGFKKEMSRRAAGRPSGAAS